MCYINMIHHYGFIDNPSNVLYYQEHSLMDLNYSKWRTFHPWNTYGMETINDGKMWSQQCNLNWCKFGTTQPRVGHLSLCPSHYEHVLLIICMSLSLHAYILLVYVCPPMSFNVNPFDNHLLLFMSVSHDIYLFVTISAIHGYGSWQLEEWHTCGFLCNHLYSWAGPHTCPSNLSQ